MSWVQTPKHISEKSKIVRKFFNNYALRCAEKQPSEIKVEQLHNIVEDTDDGETESPIEVLKEYSQETTLHGIRYVLKEGTPMQVRLCWAIALLLCAGFASWFVHSAWFEFQHSPTETRVQATHYPLYKIPFPAVTVCSSTRIYRRWGESRLVRFVKLDHRPNRTERAEFWNVMSAIALLQYPFLEAVKTPLKIIEDAYDRYEDLNITNYLFQVMPKCTDVFDECFWRGVRIDCCELFTLQRSELGFCYSFNSLTSEKTKHCTWKGMEGDSTSGDQPDSEDPICELRRNTGFGLTSGLQVKLKHFMWIDTLHLGQHDGFGYRILVHHPAEYPEASMGMLVPQVERNIYTVRVSASVSFSTEAVRELIPETRNCYFPDEKKLYITPTYSQRTCIIECRLQYIIKMCDCVPYYLWQPGNITSCPLSKFQCISDLSEYLRTYAAPENIRGLDNMDVINCSYCLPTCHSTDYEIDVSLHEDFNSTYLRKATFLEVYYKNLGAVLYKTDLAFGRMQLVVSFGGIVGLFLGVSILTGVEFIFYGTKLLASIVGFFLGRCSCKDFKRPHSGIVETRYEYDDNMLQKKKQLPPIHY